MREQIKSLIQQIKPLDSLEAGHISNAIEWIDSGVEIFRIAKPATPPKHLVSYFVLVDSEEKKILLVDHKKAGLWLPAGGHVEKDEHPNTTVKREIEEELSMSADFLSENPLFITQNETVGSTIEAGHTDVSLWYVLRGDSEKEITFDPGEFNGVKWFSFDEVLKTEISKLDPQMHRFAEKLFVDNGIIQGPVSKII